MLSCGRGLEKRHEARRRYSRLAELVSKETRHAGFVARTPHIHFLALIIIGGLAGWIAGMVAGDVTHPHQHSRRDRGLLDRLAARCDGAIFPVGSLQQFVAALVGSIIVLAVWRRWKEDPALAGSGPAGKDAFHGLQDGSVEA